MRALALITGLALITFAFPAVAHANDKNLALLDLPAGHSLLHISAQARERVDQDMLVANLRFEAEDTDPARVQDSINTAMKKALENAEDYGQVRAITRQYNVRKDHRKRNDRRPPRWRGQQGLVLKSTKSESVIELAGELQNMGFIMSGLSYTLSTDRFEKVQDRLMEQALAKLQAKAMRAAKALGKSNAELLEINVEGPGHRPQRMLRHSMAMAESASVSAPSASPGESDVKLSVSAKALLKP